MYLGSKGPRPYLHITVGGAFRSADQSLLSGSGSPARAGQAKRAISSNPRKPKSAQTPGHKGSDISEREREIQV